MKIVPLKMWKIWNKLCENKTKSIGKYNAGKGMTFKHNYLINGIVQKPEKSKVTQQENKRKVYEDQLWEQVSLVSYDNSSSIM